MNCTFKIFFTLLASTLMATSAFALTDHEIMEVMKTANEAEIDAAEVAKSRATNEEVRGFANHMINEHEQNKKDGKELAKKVDLKFKNSDLSKQLKKDAKAMKSQLKDAKGDAFNRLYVDQQVTMHTQLMNDIDQKFLPNVQNPQLKEYLQTTRTHVEQHLTKAKELQATLAR